MIGNHKLPSGSPFPGSEGSRRNSSGKARLGEKSFGMLFHRLRTGALRGWRGRLVNGFARKSRPIERYSQRCQDRNVAEGNPESEEIFGAEVKIFEVAIFRGKKFEAFLP